LLLQTNDLGKYILPPPPNSEFAFFVISCQIQYKLKESPLQSVQHVNFIKTFVLLTIAGTQRSALSSLIQTPEKKLKETEATKKTETLSQAAMSQLQKIIHFNFQFSSFFQFLCQYFMFRRI
jgi:hypothetical protein